MKYDICIVGSGAGAGPVAYTLSKAGYKVAVLEKGKYYKTEDFSKDEIANCRRSIYTPPLDEQFHTLEEKYDNGYKSFTTKDSGWDFSNGNIVGGSSNFMAGYFHKLSHDDFQLKTKYGSIEGANIQDWPIGLKELKPYYKKVSEVVGVSGENLPFKPLHEHPLTEKVDKASKSLRYKCIKTPRAILSSPFNNRNSCSYSSFCGSYGCSTDAKGSSRAALLEDAKKTNNCEIITDAFVYRLETIDKKIVKAHYFDSLKRSNYIEADIFVVAAQAIETCRLLLNSKSKLFPNGLSNNNGQVGKNFIFSAGGNGYGELNYDDKSFDGLFINRTITEFYEIDINGKKQKGGIIDILFEHANPIKKANILKWDNGKLLIGEALQERLFKKFRKTKRFKYEIFCDWLPHDNCFVNIDTQNKDKYGINVAKIRINAHSHDLTIAKELNTKAKVLFKQMGLKNIEGEVSPYPPQNLQAGGCRFGNNPSSSVLDKNCKSHEVENLYITDGSFMPTGGSVPFTWTIYANSFRVAEIILQRFQ